MTGSTTVTVRAPAKVNLSLAVGPRRSDGYHALATVYQAVGLYDVLVAEPAPPGRVTLEFAGGSCGVPDDQRNLAVQAARALARRTSDRHGVHLRLRKEIPVAGGMAGGSADAAAALVACDRLWDTRLAEEDLLDIAAGLGSDVPFCLRGGTAVGTGRGERLRRLETPGALHWVVALAEGGLSTPAVYAEHDRLCAAGADACADRPVVPDALLEALAAGDARAVGAALHNDLQPAALSLRPDLTDVLAAGERSGALGALVSGSGPTCVFLASDAAHGEELAGRLAGGGHRAAVRLATGPVPGPLGVSP